MTGVQTCALPILTIFIELFDAYQLTLREQTHCCSLLSLSIRTTPSNHKLFPLFLCLLIVLKVKQPEKYKQFVSGTLSPIQLIEHIKMADKKGTLFESNYGMALEAYIIASKSNHFVDDEIKVPYIKIRDSDSSSETEKHRASRILNILESFDWHGGIGSLGYLVKKIEIASRFST